MKENISQIKYVFDDFVASDISRPFCKAYQMNISIKLSNKSIYQLFETPFSSLITSQRWKMNGLMLFLTSWKSLSYLFFLIKILLDICGTTEEVLHSDWVSKSIIFNVADFNPLKICIQSLEPL